MGGDATSRVKVIPLIHAAPFPLQKIPAFFLAVHGDMTDVLSVSVLFFFTPTMIAVYLA